MGEIARQEQTALAHTATNRKESERCAYCGYDLRAHPAGHCPECGRPRRIHREFSAAMRRAVRAMCVVILVTSEVHLAVLGSSGWPSRWWVIPRYFVTNLAWSITHPHWVLTSVRLLSILALWCVSVTVWRQFGEPGRFPHWVALLGLAVGGALLSTLGAECYDQLVWPTSERLGRPYELSLWLYTILGGCHVTWLVGWAVYFERVNRKLNNEPRIGARVLSI